MNSWWGRDCKLWKRVTLPFERLIKGSMEVYVARNMVRDSTRTIEEK
jgi:hypothetical protein